MSFTVPGYPRSSLRSPSSIEQSLEQEEPTPEIVFFSMDDLGAHLRGKVIFPP